MNNAQVINAFFKANGLKVLSGNGESMMSFLPFFMMDACYQLYTKDIAPLDVKFEAKRWKNVWKDAYNKFNHMLFKSFNADQEDYVIDKMDEFEKYAMNHIVILKVQLIGMLREMGIDDDEGQVIAASITCNTLAQSAQSIWKRTYQGIYGNFEDNPYITNIERATIKFAEAYRKSTITISINRFPKIVEAMNILCKKMVAWVAADMESKEEAS